MVFLHDWLLGDIIECLVLGGENGSFVTDLFFIRNFSSTDKVIGIRKSLDDRDNIIHLGRQCVQSCDVLLAYEAGLGLMHWFGCHGDVLGA